MLRPRVIPCLLVRNGELVKTVRFGKDKYVGDPINVVKIFNDKQVDEIVVLDISATVERREPNYSLIEELASECFMPLCYGGGVSSAKTASKLVALGVEKIAINAAAQRDMSVLREIAAELGSQSVVGCVDVKRTWRGSYRVFDYARRRTRDLDPVDYATQLVEHGAGEVFVNSVDNDGTRTGYDLTLIRKIASRVCVPTIACGGASTLEHIRAVIKDSGAAAAAAGSMFVFNGPHRAVLVSYPPLRDLERVFGA